MPAAKRRKTDGGDGAGEGRGHGTPPSPSRAPLHSPGDPHSQADAAMGGHTHGWSGKYLANLKEVFDKVRAGVDGLTEGGDAQGEGREQVHADLIDLSIKFKAVIKEREICSNNAIESRLQLHTETQMLAGLKYVLNHYDKQIAQALRHQSKYTDAELDILKDGKGESSEEDVAMDEGHAKLGKKHEIYKGKLEHESTKRQQLKDELQRVSLVKKEFKARLEAAKKNQGSLIKCLLSLRENHLKLQHLYEMKPDHLPVPLQIILKQGEAEAASNPSLRLSLRVNGSYRDVSEYLAGYKPRATTNSTGAYDESSDLSHLLLFHPITLLVDMSPSADSTPSSSSGDVHLVFHFHPGLRTVFLEVRPAALLSPLQSLYPDDKGERFEDCVPTSTLTVKHTSGSPSYLGSSNLGSFVKFKWLEKLCALPHSAAAQEDRDCDGAGGPLEKAIIDACTAKLFHKTFKDISRVVASTSQKA